MILCIPPQKQKGSNIQGAKPLSPAASMGWISIALMGLLVGCSSTSPTATFPTNGSDPGTSSVSMVAVDEADSPEPTAETEELGSSCLQILEINPTNRVHPGDQVEIEVRCVFTSNPERVRVTFGADGDSPETVVADEIIPGILLRRTIVATVPLEATTGLITVEVGRFRSAMSTDSIEIPDEEGVIWTGPGVKLRVAEDLSQVLFFSFEPLSGETPAGDSCTFGGSGSFSAPLDVDPVDGTFSLDGGPFDILGEFTSDTSAEGTVTRAGCIAGWSASPGI